jgi:Asp-tRNA(Asn)/Glu-tRNA(Gln) amidotransferase A subunit family amidase
MARTVADCLLFENQLAGPAPDDIVSLRPKLELPEQLDGVEGMRIAVSPDLGDWVLDDEVRRNTLDLATALRDQGAIVEEVDLVVPRAIVQRATAIHFHLGFGAWVASEAIEHGDQMTAYAKEFPRWAAEVSGEGTWLEKVEIEAQLYLPVGALLSQYDALICATNGTRGLIAGDDYVGHGLDVGGQHLEFYFESILTPVFNIFSRCPVLNVPSGFADNGVPTGVQIVANTYDDLTAFRVGAACERARPWMDVPERQPQIEVAQA